MKNSYIRNIFIQMLLFLCTVLLFAENVGAQCGADIYVLNDNSGSVDATELRQSREFVTRFALEMSPLGTANNQTRIAIANFAAKSTFAEYDFPIATSRYTTEMADIVSYENSPRLLSGQTDVGDATYNASLVAGLPAIPGRNVAQILVILTDAYDYQVPPNIISFANNLKSQGFSIIVMAIDAATSDPELPQVASPGGYFTAGDYQSLENGVITYAQSLATRACTYVPPTPRPDLNVTLSNFNIINCLTTPTSSVSYQVNNIGDASFSGNLYISLYDANPRLPGANLLGVRNAGTTAIAAGSSASGTITSSQIAGFNSASTLYAVVNFRGNLAGNQVPVAAQLSQSQLAVTTPVAEKITTNNFSSGALVNLGTGCNTAILDMKVTSSGGACDDEVKYTIEVCNKGAVSAALNDLLVDQAPGFNLLNKTSFCASVPLSFSQLGQDIVNSSEFGGFVKVDLSEDGYTLIVSGNEGYDSPGAFQVYDYNTNSGLWVERGLPYVGEQSEEAFVYRGIPRITADGNRIAIPSYGYFNGTNTIGRVRVFDWDAINNKWVQVGNTLFGTVGQGRLANVAISDNGQRIVASSGYFARVYELQGNTWTQIGPTISGLATDNSLGNYENAAISSDGTRIFFGADGSDNGATTNVGEVRVYNWNAGASNWVLEFSDYGTVSGDGFGRALSASPDGNTFVATAPSNTTGYARVYTRSGGTWVLKGNEIPAPWYMMTSGLSNSGNRLSVGTYGQAYIYDFNETLGDWERLTLTNVQFYTSVNGDGKIIAFGGGITRVLVQDPCLLAPNECKTVNYVYNVSGAAAGTYDFDVVLNASKANAAHANPVINPDKNFLTQNSLTTGSGWDGSKHAGENVTIFGSTFCNTTHTMGITASLSPTAVCAGGFTTATVTITNPYPIDITNTNLVLNLGNGAIYASEPYNRTGMVIPTFPGLNGATGSNTIPVFILAPGTNSFQIDIAVATGTNTLTTQLTNINPAFNNGSATTTQVSRSVTGQANPTFTGTCPGNITFGTTTVNLNYTVTGSSTRLWTSGTNGVFSNPTSGTTTYTINPQDVANGFVDFALTAKSSLGCDNTIYCRVNITNVPRDYGDAPITYDLNASTIPVVAAHSLIAGLHLGVLAPDAEASNQPSVGANLEPEDDGLLLSSFFIPSSATTFSLPISVTNSTTNIAFANAFIDWNNDGDFLDANETGTEVAVNANSGTTNYSVNFTVPAGLTMPINTYVRLRVATLAEDVRRSFSVASGGEVEDFTIRFTSNYCDDFYSHVQWEYNTIPQSRNARVSAGGIIKTNASASFDGPGISGSYMSNSPSQSLQIPASSLTATTFAGAIAANDYVQMSFTTINNLSGGNSVVGTNLWIEQDDYYTQNPVPDASQMMPYQFALQISTTSNFSSGVFTILQDQTVSYKGARGLYPFVGAQYNLSPNTTYYLRYYLYNVQASSGTIIFDDQSPIFRYCHFYAISGNVFNDVNGNTLVDGTELGTSAGTNLYMYLVNASGMVLDSAKVSNTGSYILQASPGANYTVQLSTVQYPVGYNTNTAPINHTLPANWVRTGENGAGNTGTGDGNPDGILAINVGTASMTNQNFGIEQPPTAGSGTNTAGNPGGSTQVSVPANTFTNTMVSSDPTLVTGMRITAFPTGAASIVVNGITYNSNVPVEVAALTALIIPTDVSGNPTVSITIDPIGTGATSVSIPFKAIDAAGKESTNIGTAVLTLIGVPDLTPVIELPLNTFVVNETRNLVVYLEEVKGFGTLTGVTTFTLTVPGGYELAPFNSGLTSIIPSGGGSTAVSNTEWDMLYQDGTQVMLRAKAGIKVNAYGVKFIGFSVKRTTSISLATANMTADIVPDAAQTRYDSNNNNNTYGRVVVSN